MQSNYDDYQINSTVSQIKNRNSVTVIRYITHVCGREVDCLASTIKYKYNVTWKDMDLAQLANGEFYRWPTNTLVADLADETTITIVELEVV